MAAPALESVSNSTNDSQINGNEIGLPRRRDAETAQAEMRVLLICHAEDMHGLYRDLKTESSGLSANGWEQADILATWLRSHELIDQLVSDSLLQCRLTAQRVGQALGLPVMVLRDLPTCMPRTVQAGEPGSLAMRSLDNQALTPVEPEQPEQIEQVQTMVATLDKLFAEHWGMTMAVVTCSTNIERLLCYLARTQDIDLSIDHTGISEIAFVNGRWRINYVNRSPHLPAPVVAPRNPREETAQTQDEMEDLSTIIQVYNRVATVGDLERKRLDDRARIRDLLAFAKIPNDARVLDIGTGLGLLPLMLAEQGALSVVGIDVSPEMLELAEYLRLSQPGGANSRVSYRLAPAHALPFQDETFDAVTMRLVLNHVRRPERILREAVRVLKPGGFIVMAELLGVDNPVKRATQNAIEARRNPAHVAARGADQYYKMLTDMDLTIEAKETVNFERELDEWLAIYQTDRADAAVVREMIEAGLETDAAGMNVRRQSNTLVFDQRMVYIKAMKPPHT